MCDDIVGNAAFHSDLLYPQFVTCVEPLLNALENDADDKTRVNAAGAIGNLVRNSSHLAGAMSQHSAPAALLKTIVVEKDVSVQRVALFSLGTMAVYSECR